MFLNECEQKHGEMEKEKQEMGWKRFQEMGWRPEAEQCMWGQGWEGEEVTWQLEGV